MVRKCCVGSCKSQYGSQKESVKWHNFPSDPTERARWINSLSNILPDGATDKMVVCVKHWPPNYETYKKKGHHVPVNPPSVFSVPSSFARQTICSPPRKIESSLVKLMLLPDGNVPKTSHINVILT